MDTYVSQPGIQTPTNVLKNIDTQTAQSLTIISENDFRKFVPSGWKVVVSLPLQRITNRAIFAIDISGYMPYWNLGDSFYMTALKNLAPVQAFSHSMSYVKIYHEQLTLPIMTMYHSHRAIAGNVKVGLRVQSNTSQSGSFLVSQLNTGIRNYYKRNEEYTGLRFLNSSSQATDYAMNSFFLGDLSINRNWSITPMAQNTLPRVDLAYKLAKLQEFSQEQTIPQDLKTWNPYLTQFAEDWLLFMPLSDLPNANGNQITFEVFYDYTDVEFYTPMLPLIANTNTNSNQQILNVSATINNKKPVSKSDAVWGVASVVVANQENNDDPESTEE